MIKYLEKQNTDEELFTILNPYVKTWFERKFKTFAIPQRFGVMQIHSRNNILISSPTGSGKTLTAFLAILNELIDSSDKGILENKIHCIYVSPLKALNADIEHNLLEPLKEIEAIAGKAFNIRVAVRTGDTTTSEKTKMLKNPPHILITTPESLAIVLASIKFRDHMKDVQWCIIDEIHSLAENKRGVHMSLSMERLQHMSLGMTRIGLSATVAPLDDVAQFLAGTERDCMVVDVQYLKQLDLKVMSPVPDLINTTHGDLHHAMYSLIDKLVQEHKTTLIFTNTRAATERVVHFLKEKFPKNYNDTNIGAHHGSLSKEHRSELESNLRKGKLQCVVCSTSLELGIDIGYIDLVILLGSPKSVARALQRIGRSGHQLHATTKGRIIVMDRDDLVECSVLLKSALEKKIDRIHIPDNCLDVLVQHVHGMALEEKILASDMYAIIKQSYCYRNLTQKDFNEIVDYLAGKFVSLEDRNVYAKIWHDEATGMIGKRGRMSRVIHMSNIGTIPDQSGVIVKEGEKKIGMIDEGFLERLKPRDIFVLGGNTYRFKFSRGMVAQVDRCYESPPTVPSWVSEMLPLSFDLAMEIGKFRRLMAEKFEGKKTKEEIIAFIKEYLYVDENATLAIHEYFKEQYDYVAEIPTDQRILIEHTEDEEGRKYIVFHTLYGRRVNDCLSRAIAFAIARLQHRDVEMGISDNGFYLVSHGKFQPVQALKVLKPAELRKVMNLALDQTEVLRRRFRHCANRALMILRTYMGHTKRVGRQQVSSMILMSAVKRISPDFCILREARREVLEDLMDIENAEKVLNLIAQGKIKIAEIYTKIPSPFAFDLVLQGHLDIMKIEDKVEFLRRMHQNVLAKISLGKR